MEKPESKNLADAKPGDTSGLKNENTDSLVLIDALTESVLNDPNDELTSFVEDHDRANDVKEAQRVIESALSLIGVCEGLVTSVVSTEIKPD